MWWQDLHWSDTSQSGKLGFIVAGGLAMTGGLIVVASLTVLIGSGELSMLMSSSDSRSFGDEIVLANGGDSTGANVNQAQEGGVLSQIVVDVSGAVNFPGLYELPNGSRLGKALEKAGGLASGADTKVISQELNLASFLQDGQKVYIPFQNETGSQLSSNTATVGVSGQATELVSINKASRSELMELEGIGEKRAEAIIAGRPYTSIDQLVSEGALTAGVLAKIQNLLEL